MTCGSLILAPTKEEGTLGAINTKRPQTIRVVATERPMPNNSRTPFPHPGYQDTSIIPLTKGKAVIVDDDDLKVVVQFRWSALNSRQKEQHRNHWYAQRTHCEPLGKKQGRLLHRELMSAQKGQQVDHINGNGLDCRRSNMRIATRSQNCHNRKGWVHRSFPYKGIGKSTRSWNASIFLPGRKRLYRGGFATAEDAALAYDEMAREHFGEFAALNFPNTTETAVR